jgi:hypothetical protein
MMKNANRPRCSSRIHRWFLVVVALLAASPIGAWDQETHTAINQEAVVKFEKAFAGEPKYILGPLNPKREFYTGVGLISAHYFAATLRPSQRTLEWKVWIAKGGDWADEPQLYAAVRHFYDPLALSGSHHLTDQSAAHARYDQPMMDAVTWALSAADNPFCWREALTAYKRAMEIPEDGQKPDVIRGSHFKLDVALRPKDRAEEREIHLARADRGLGETLHLLADMTQPAHVRNDSHPRDEPVEDNVNAKDVGDFAGKSVDARMVPQLRSAGGGRLHLPEQLFYVLASFTNRHFYSSDTVYDGPAGVNPRNQEIPYPSPQFSDLKRRTVKINTDGDDIAVAGKDGTELDAWVGSFVGETIPLATEGLYWYYVSPAFAKRQARVLIPIAVNACADLMHQFYPTLELEGRFEDPELLVDEVKRKPLARHRVEVGGTMVHHVDRDPAWEEQELSISYSGPAGLVFSNDGRVRREIPVVFHEGRLTQYRDHRGDLVDGPLHLHLHQVTGPRPPKAEAHTGIDDGDVVYVEVKAGSRTFTGPKLRYTFPVDRIEAEFSDLGLRPDEDDSGLGVRRIAVAAEAINRTFDRRPGEIQLAPAFTGPVDLAFVDEEGRLSKTVPLWFEEGRLSRISDPGGRLIDEPLVLYGDESSQQKLTDQEEVYEVEPGHTVSLVLRVDEDRRIRSNVWTYGQESEEIDGTYHGTLRIGGSEKLRGFVVNVFSVAFYPVAQAIAKMADAPPMSFAEVRDAVDDNTTTNTVEAPITLTVVTESARRVAIDLTISMEDGTDTRVAGSGTFQGGELRFSVRFRDGSELEMAGRLRGSTLRGTATGHAWGVVGDAAHGSWRVRRE